VPDNSKVKKNKKRRSQEEQDFKRGAYPGRCGAGKSGSRRGTGGFPTPDLSPTIPRPVDWMSGRNLAEYRTVPRGRTRQNCLTIVGTQNQGHLRGGEGGEGSWGRQQGQRRVKRGEMFIDQEKSEIKSGRTEGKSAMSPSTTCQVGRNLCPSKKKKESTRRREKKDVIKRFEKKNLAVTRGGNPARTALKVDGGNHKTEVSRRNCSNSLP